MNACYVIKSQRIDVTPFMVSASASLQELTDRLVTQNQAILFVVSGSGEFVGAVTKGDINKVVNQTEAAQGHLTASDICNRSPRTVKAQLSDTEIAKCFDSRIHCVPLIDDANKLVAVAIPEPRSSRLNLNIGAGATVFDGFVNLDVKSDWYAAHHATAESGTNATKFVEYNILTDVLPYDADSVDNIYLSHVVEHLADEAVAHFLQDCARVLKPGGVMRVACPDAEFLAQISASENDFWYWRRDWFRVHAPQLNPTDITQFDYLVREVATQKAGCVRASDFPADCLSAENWYSTLEKLTEGLTFNADTIGNHINFWTFDKLAFEAERAGFKHVIRSRYQGSVSQDMKGKNFDQTRPEMSLYVDLIG